jgi:hypothetical protein
MDLSTALSSCCRKKMRRHAQVSSGLYVVIERDAGINFLKNAQAQSLPVEKVRLTGDRRPDTMGQHGQSRIGSCQLYSCCLLQGFAPT